MSVPTPPGQPRFPLAPQPWHRTGETPDDLPDVTDDPDLPSAEETGQATTVEEAMDALTQQEGHAEESAYAPTSREPGADDLARTPVTSSPEEER